MANVTDVETYLSSGRRFRILGSPRLVLVLGMFRRQTEITGIIAQHK